VCLPTYTLPQNVVLQIPLARNDNPFGCGLTADCGCPPPDHIVYKFSRQYFVPPEAASFVNLEELNELIDELNLIYKNNTVAGGAFGVGGRGGLGLLGEVYVGPLYVQTD
jgi:hypothetical protein